VVKQYEGATRGHRQARDGEPNDRLWVQQVARNAVRGLDAQPHRIVRIAQVQANGVTAEHVLGLDDEIAQDFVQAPTGVDDCQKVAQTFGAETAIDVDVSGGHGSPIYRTTCSYSTISTPRMPMSVAWPGIAQ
jgi:hypothetical protein